MLEEDLSLNREENLVWNKEAVRHSDYLFQS